MDLVFNLHNVTRKFGTTHAINGITFAVQPGERVALLGPSGAGKSTLLALLNVSQLPDTGNVQVMGKDTHSLRGQELRAIQGRIGTIYQHLNLVGALSVIHNINAGCLARWSLLKSLWSLFEPQNVSQAAESLLLVGIPEKLYERTDSLSGGQQQRVAIARVLVQNPDVILADEPIASIDPERSHEVMALLCSLCQQLNKTLIVSLHAPEFAFAYCTRIIGMRDGLVVFDAPATQVTQDMVMNLYRIRQ